MTAEGSVGNQEPLVVVSNRLPYSLPLRQGSRSPKRNVGGLVNAVEPVLASRGGRWVGWDGALLSSRRALTSSLSNLKTYQTPTGIDLLGVPLSEREVRFFYHGFANRALWPLFHDFPGKSTFASEDYAAYVAVNRRFAEITLPLAEASRRVWVHDFQLMLVPRFLREMGFRGRIDFFLHIPFPPPEIYRALPWRNELLEGVLSSDTIAFHVSLYRQNFIDTAVQLTGSRARLTDPGGPVYLVHDRGEASVLVVPIGIDVDEFERISRKAAVEARVRRLKESHRGCRILFGTDRLDYTKGIKQRLSAVERFLSRNREAIGKVILVQFVVPSRSQVAEYRALKQEIDREVGRINGELGRDSWIPIHYTYGASGRDDLVAYYRAADVALVTPLRDGMNLVAAEFAACRIDGDGVLIVSEFAGIAEHAPGAILVNPHDLDGCAEAIATALKMDPEGRRNRMAMLRRQVRANPVSKWAELCLDYEQSRAPVPLAQRQLKDSLLRRGGRRKNTS